MGSWSRLAAARSTVIARTSLTTRTSLIACTSLIAHSAAIAEDRVPLGRCCAPAEFFHVEVSNAEQSVGRFAPRRRGLRNPIRADRLTQVSQTG